MSQTKEQRLAGVHERAMRQFDRIQTALRDERAQCLSDRRFYSIAGAQWEGPLGDQFENKPKFEMNKVHLAVIRIINEYRNNRITVDFTPKDGKKADSLADACDGLYRADEQDFNADEALDNAFEEAVGGGIGAWRLRACYEDEDDDENTRQRIKFEPIHDADTSVYFDLDAKRQDKSDAKRGYVIFSMERNAYEEEYEDDPASWPKNTGIQFDWCTPDVVYLAEYYEVEQKSELVSVYRGLALSDTDEADEVEVTEADLKADPDKEDELLATGFRKVREKRVKRTRVHKYLLNGARVLEDQGIIAGSYIPIIVTYGKRWFVDNVERCMGHVRLARDAQMLANMLRSWLAEIASMSKVAKPIVTPEQMAGHANMWSRDNIDNYPFLLLNGMVGPDGQPLPAAAMGYTKTPEIPPALAALLTVTEQDLQDLLGNQQAGEEMQSNISGKVVELIQTRLDMQTYIYISNMAKAVRHCGRVWLSMARDVYVEEGRPMKSVAPDGDVGSLEIMQPMHDLETSETLYDNDLTRAHFDVAVEVGPSSSSRRQATVRMLTSMLAVTSDPQTKSVLESLIMMNMEGEGISDVRDFFRKKLLRVGALKPTDEEKAELQDEEAQTPPDPNTKYLESAAREADAKATKAQADTVLNLAKAEEVRANTVKILADASATEQEKVARLIAMVREASQPTQLTEAPAG